MLARAAALLALAGTVLLVALVLVGGSPYRVGMEAVNAGQLVVGNQVKVGGAVVGTVSGIRLLPSGVAGIELTLDRDQGHLHEGTKAIIRSGSVAGSANHFVSLVPGPRTNPAIPSGGHLGVAATTAPVDFDALLDALDAPTRNGLRDLIRGAAQQYRGRAPDARRSLGYLAPALGGTTGLLRELQRDRAATTRLLVKGAVAARATAAKRAQLTELITNAATTTGALADRDQALGRTIDALPGTLRKANTTFAGLRSTLNDLGPLVDAATPATRRLAPFLRELRPLTAEAVPTTRELADAFSTPGADDDLVDLVRRLQPLGRVVRGAAPHIVRGLDASQHDLDQLLAYTPDLASATALLDASTSYYDANGHYARAQPSLFKLHYDAPSRSLALQDDSRRLDGLELHRGARCPGAAAPVPADGSAPRRAPGCDPSNVLPGP